MRRRHALGLAAGALVPPVLPKRSPRSASADGSGLQPDPFAPLGQESIPGAKELVLSDDGATAYLATTDGFAIVDVADPSTPDVLAERRDLLADREDGPMAAIWDVKVDGDRLAVVGSATDADTVAGVILYDVSEPESPEQVAFYETSFPIHNAFLADGIAYLTAGTGIAMIDVDRQEPREVGRWSPVDVDGRWSDVTGYLRAPHDLWVQDGTAYVACWDAGTWIVDASDPAAPSHLGTVGGGSPTELAELSSSAATIEANEPPGNHHYVQASEDGSLLAVGKESWATSDDSGGPSGIDLWDVSDPAAPRKRSTVAPPRAVDEQRDGTWTTSHNFDLAGDRLFSSWYQGGVKIYDIADPGDPEELAWWRRPEDAAFWAAVRATDEFFVASSTSHPQPTVTDGLYTFPNRAGEQADPPPLTETATGRTLTGRTTTRRRTSSTTGGDGATTPEETGPEPGTAAPSQSGFGLPAALGGVALGAWWKLRGDRG